MDHYAKAAELLRMLDLNPELDDAQALATTALAHATLAAAGLPRNRRIVATPAPAKRKASK